MAGSDSTPNGREAGSWKMSFVVPQANRDVCPCFRCSHLQKSANLSHTPETEKKEEESAVKSNRAVSCLRNMTAAKKPEDFYLASWRKVTIIPELFSHTRQTNMCCETRNKHSFHSCDCCLSTRPTRAHSTGTSKPGAKQLLETGFAKENLLHLSGGHSLFFL